LIKSPPNDPARIAAVIASDPRFAYFASAAFAIRLLRMDQKIVVVMPFQALCAVRRQDVDAVRGRAGGCDSGL
jgi:hypothetical protein